MQDIQIILAATTSIILFIFGLEHFSREIQRITGESFRKFLSRTTKIPIIGLIIGAIVTAFIQSSSATSVIAISLVNAGVLSFKNSISIILGANIGTTITAQLVAFKLTSFAPFFIIIGFLLSFIKSKYSIFAKSLFYFGFVFFSLNLISSTLQPLQNDQRIIEFLTGPQNPFITVLIGALITAVLQSSSVTTGLAIIFTQQGIMSLDNAMFILLGANIGTTVTALFSIISMDIAAKKTAMAHFFFNLGGVIIFFPIVVFLKQDFPLLSNNPAIALANFHLLFNSISSFAFLIFLKPFTNFIEKLMVEVQMDFERIDINHALLQSDFANIEEELEKKICLAYEFIQENYNLITLSIETNYSGVYEAAKKRIEYFEFFRTELMSFFSNYIGHCNDEEALNSFIKIMTRYEYLFQLHDSIQDINSIKVTLDENYIELKSDILIIVREISSETLSLFELIGKKEKGPNFREELRSESHDFQSDLNKHNKNILKIMSLPHRSDAGAVLHLVTFSQRLKDKLIHFHSLMEEN